MDKSTVAVLSGIGALLAGNAVHAALFKPKNEAVEPLNDSNVDLDRYRKHLSEAIRFKTISHVNKKETDWSVFEEFHAFIDREYPNIKEKLEKEIVPPASIIFRWKGRDEKLDPIALCAHQDVVPVSSGTESDWTHPAFDGVDDGEFIWGRGALDMKNHLICVLEAVETLLEEGFEPERDVYLLFGDNEEVVGGTDNGAGKMAALLEERGVKLDAVLDEGGAMLPVNVKGVMNNKYLAGIGIAEKGYADIKITVTAKGGHSSQPPKHTALGKIADVVKDLENHQFKSTLTPQMKDLFDQIARSCTFPARLLTCNIRLLNPLIKQIMKLIPPAASMIRTTTGVTMAEGSPAANVLPQRASITVNFRGMPGTSTQDIVNHIKKVSRHKDIELSMGVDKEASMVSPTDSRAFKIIAKNARAIEPNAIVAPFLVMGGTDAYHYENICKNIYRYAPFRVSTSLLLCTHGTNERIPIACMEDALRFFKAFIRDASAE